MGGRSFSLVHATGQKIRGWVGSPSTPTSRASSTVLYCPGVAAGKGQGHSPSLMTPGPDLPPAIGWPGVNKGEDTSPLPMLLPGRQVVGLVLSCSHPWGWFPCAPVQCLFSQVLQQVRGRDSSPGLITLSEPTLPTTSGEGKRGGEGNLSLNDTTVP